MKEKTYFLDQMGGVGMGWGSCILALKPEMWISGVVLIGISLVLTVISNAEPKP